MREHLQTSWVRGWRWILLAGVALATALSAWWLVARSEATAFLAVHPGAEWILDARPMENRGRYAHPTVTDFKHTFTLAAVPDQATLSVRAFRSAAVSVNGRPVGPLSCDGIRWKSAVTADVRAWLQAGTNELAVSVTNALGPPALWLRLQAGALSLGSDATWLTSLAGAPWVAAKSAAAPVELPDWSSLNERRPAGDSLRRAWPALLAFGVAALGLVYGGRRWLGPRVAAHPSRWLYLLLAIVVLARVALFVHDAPRLPRMLGFDAFAHEEYVRFIQEKSALPLPNDGWEMHQPPLYYAASALWLNGLGCQAGSPEAVLPLRAVNGVIGLLQCWLVLLCLRRLFPGEVTAPAVGLIVAGFLPANLYLSFYVANDSLAALLVTLALYLLLRLLAAEGGNLRLAAGLGLALGLALLAKLTSLLAVPVVLAALAWPLLRRRDFSPRAWGRGVGLVTLVLVLVCGWHFGRVWLQIGSLPLPNSQTDLASAWWQDPGFRTAGYYLHFGRSLAAPIFSVFASFADGIYSTLWADGLVSGAAHLMFRPPWDYDLMHLGGWLALVLTLLAVGGLGLAVRNFIRAPEPVPLLLAGMVLAFAAGIILLTLRSPWLASVKAFYALPALAPFCALIAAGWRWLAQKYRAAPPVLWAVVLVWAFTVFGAFWIRESNPETWRSRGIDRMKTGNPAAAVADLQSALRLNPADAVGHYLLAETLNLLDRSPEAVREYEAALQLQPDSPVTLGALAQLLAQGGPEDIQRAVGIARRACELVNYRVAKLVYTLADTLDRAGQAGEAVASFELAARLAAQDLDASLEETARSRLAMALNNQAWRLAASPDAARRDGAKAVGLARRACELTADANPVFLGTLAAAFAEAGQFDQAIATAQKAMAVATAQGQTEVVTNNARLLELYKTGRPYHEPPQSP